MANAIMLIHPYRNYGEWVFDDPETGLVKEPFISGADTIIDAMVAHLPDAASGFQLFFSAHPFPGYQLELNWQRSEFDGNWYHSEVLDMEGWLCPALLKYFDDAPKTIYAQFKQRKP
jgi:hypothetical protein